MNKLITAKDGRKTLYLWSDDPDQLFDSKGEAYIACWLNELKSYGLIREWNAQPESFLLTEKIIREVRKPLKTKVKFVEESVLPSMSYTADFGIVWDIDKALNAGLVCEFIGKEKKLKHQLFSFGDKSYLEAKPDNLSLAKSFDPQGMTKAVRSKIKQVYDKHDIIVELVFHNNLFHDTFTPERYLTNDKLPTNRKINYKTRSLEEFLRDIKPISSGDLFN